AKRDASIPLVVREEEVGTTVPHPSGALLDERIDVDAVAVNVVHEHRAAVLLGEAVAEVDHRAAVRVSAAELIGDREVLRRPALSTVVEARGDRLDLAIDVIGKMRSRLTDIPCARDHVIEVRDDTGRDERLAVIVEVDAPRIARPRREDLELLAKR